MLELTDLTKKYGDFTAVNHISSRRRKRGNIRPAGAERRRKINNGVNDQHRALTDGRNNLH